MLGEARRPQGQALAARAWYQQRLRSYTCFVSLVDRFFVAGRSLETSSLKTGSPDILMKQRKCRLLVDKQRAIEYP